MNVLLTLLIAFTSAVAFAAKPPDKICDANLNPVLTDTDDLHLEEVHGTEALDWVKKQNTRSLGRLQSDPRYNQINSSILEVLNSPDRLPGISIRKEDVLNFWKDAKNTKGLLRRIKYSDFIKGSRTWETILDVDALAKAENENWVYDGGPQFGSRKLLSLSRDGKDANVVREFDMVTKEFIKDGFILPEGKHNITWVDQDTVIVGLARPDQPNDVTDSGYPRTLRLWKRGTAFETAPIILEIAKTDMSASASIDRDVTDGPVKHIVISNQKDFYSGEAFLLQPNGKLAKLEVPADAEYTIHRDQLFVKTMSPWDIGGVTHKVGTLLRFKLDEFMAGKSSPDVLFVSKHESILESYLLHADRIFLTVKQHVVSRVVELVNDKGTLQLKALSQNAEPFVMQSIYTADEDQNVLILQETGYLTPTTRTLVNLADNSISKVDQTKEWFDATPYVVEQKFATSKDGTKVPYFLVRRKDMKFDGNQPVLQYGYGGFLISEEPYYSVGFARGWLEQGGALVVTNIRGGGEYGAEWHDAALKENRQRAYDDFHAVAEDLIANKITSSRRLGVMGGSNGGLLTGVAFTQRPELYSAAVVSVPLLDMLRYHKLHAGASWMAEYGNPDDPAMAAEIRKYSPYHNLKPGVNYIEPFFNTSTADDRVHPAHARRMAARMERLGQPFLYFENMEGGHAGSTNAEQSARLQALEYVYLLQKLKD